VKFSGKVGNGPVNKSKQIIKLFGHPDNCLDAGFVFRIRHYQEMWKVVNGHKSVAHTDSPDGGTGKTCLGRGMHCPSACSLVSISLGVWDVERMRSGQ